MAKRAGRQVVALAAAACLVCGCRGDNAEHYRHYKSDIGSYSQPAYSSTDAQRIANRVCGQSQAEINGYVRESHGLTTDEDLWTGFAFQVDLIAKNYCHASDWTKVFTALIFDDPSLGPKLPQ